VVWSTALPRSKQQICRLGDVARKTLAASQSTFAAALLSFEPVAVYFTEKVLSVALRTDIFMTAESVFGDKCYMAPMTRQSDDSRPPVFAMGQSSLPREAESLAFHHGCLFWRRTAICDLVNRLKPRLASGFNSLSSLLFLLS
jgi:hypothetical protein